jgi:phosphoenolpyruvate carboxylase
VRRMQRRARAFGFHLATLDVVQNAEVHREIVGAALGDPSWADRPPEERRERLAAALTSDQSPVGDLGPGAKRALWVFEAMEFCRNRYGHGAIGPYIVSLASGVDDVLSVLLLARWAGLVDGPGGQVTIDVAPLFESTDALAKAGEIVSLLLAEPVYRAHLAARGNRQLVTIGYADSNKSTGFVTSRWALRTAQEGMSAACDAAGVHLEVFHRRGGSISRGGGRDEALLRSTPRAVVNGRLRVTEQGESINDRYGLRPIALRTFEQTVGALALCAAGVRGPEPQDPAWREAMELLAGASCRAYRSLVHDDEAFLDYFRTVTPVDVIERMQIGSRPVSRGGRGVDSLLPIPWSFAWSQSRHMLPGWFGAGAGLAAVAERHGPPALADMYARWPYFRTLIDDMEMGLARADMGVASFYGQLARPEHGRFSKALADAFEDTVERVLAIKGCTELLASEPTLQRSIRLRNPYVDPLHLTQVDLLYRWREGDRQDREIFRALVASVNGIALGLQGSG